MVVVGAPPTPPLVLATANKEKEEGKKLEVDVVGSTIIRARRDWFDAGPAGSGYGTVTHTAPGDLLRGRGDGK